ncbi:hypothetical protein ACXET9_00500 [Brachybacterium sp. DNPG3]
MDEIWGCDTDDMLALADRFIEAAERLRRLIELLRSSSTAVAWEGPDADAHRETARSVLADLEGIGAAVGDHGEALDGEAAAQDDASAAESGGLGTGRAGLGAGAASPSLRTELPDWHPLSGRTGETGPAPAPGLGSGGAGGSGVGTTDVPTGGVESWGPAIGGPMGPAAGGHGAGTAGEPTGGSVDWGPMIGGPMGPTIGGTGYGSIDPVGTVKTLGEGLARMPRYPVPDGGEYRIDPEQLQLAEQRRRTIAAHIPGVSTVQQAIGLHDLQHATLDEIEGNARAAGMTAALPAVGAGRISLALSEPVIGERSMARQLLTSVDEEIANYQQTGQEVSEAIGDRDAGAAIGAIERGGYRHIGVLADRVTANGIPSTFDAAGGAVGGVGDIVEPFSPEAAESLRGTEDRLVGYGDRVEGFIDDVTDTEQLYALRREYIRTPWDE